MWCLAARSLFRKTRACTPCPAPGIGAGVFGTCRRRMSSSSGKREGRHFICFPWLVWPLWNLCRPKCRLDVNKNPYGFILAFFPVGSQQTHECCALWLGGSRPQILGSTSICVYRRWWLQAPDTGINLHLCLPQISELDKADVSNFWVGTILVVNAKLRLFLMS